MESVKAKQQHVAANTARIDELSAQVRRRALRAVRSWFQLAWLAVCMRWE